MKYSTSLISFLRLRKYIGILGMILPILILIVSGKQNSISASYYTDSRNVFVGLLYAIGLFFICDEGYDSKDTIANRLAGIFSMVGIANFGCNGKYAEIHYLSAFCFFTILGIICLFLFTITKGHKTPMKKKRNLVYKICGFGIFVCIILIFILSKLNIPIFIPESILLEFFGFAWLVKGDTILRD